MLRVPTCIRSGILGDQVNVFLAHHLGDDCEAGFFSRLAEQLQAFHSEALEGIWRGTRFVRASAQHARARGSHGFGSSQQLLFRLHGARPGHHDEIAATDLEIANSNHAAGARIGSGYEIKARELAVPFGIHDRRPAILRSHERPITTRKQLTFL